MAFLRDFVLEFVRLTWDVLPWFLGGAAFGAALDVWLKPEFALRHLRGGWLSMVKASVLGMIMPGCACATMPMAEGLRRKGAGLGTVTSFLLASPLASPQTLILTWAMLGWRFTAARVLACLIGGVAIGSLFLRLENASWLTVPARLPEEGRGECRSGCACSSGEEGTGKKKKFWPVFLDILKELGKYFAIGMAIASALVVAIPQDFIAARLGSSGPLAYLAAALAGVPLYVCEGEEIPLTLSFLKLGLGPGPAFTFLLGSVGTCIPTMIMSQKLIGRRGLAVYAAFWVVFALAAGLLFGLSSGL